MRVLLSSAGLGEDAGPSAVVWVRDRGPRTLDLGSGLTP
jgi:hypothetical protein